MLVLCFRLVPEISFCFRYEQVQRQQKAGEIAAKRLMSAFGGKADMIHQPNP
jgi:hypothetical protein